MSHHHLAKVPDRSTPPVLVYEDRACNGMDPDVFFSISTVAEAKAVCGRCPYEIECRVWAIETEQFFGVYGGTGGEERERLVRDRKAGI